MTQWPSRKARQVLAALVRIGWAIKRETPGSHKILSRPGWPDYVFSFHDAEEIGPKMLARIAKHTGVENRRSLDRSIRYFSKLPSMRTASDSRRNVEVRLFEISRLQCTYKSCSTDIHTSYSTDILVCHLKRTFKNECPTIILHHSNTSPHISPAHLSVLSLPDYCTYSSTHS